MQAIVIHQHIGPTPGGADFRQSDLIQKNPVGRGTFAELKPQEQVADQVARLQAVAVKLPALTRRGLPRQPGGESCAGIKLHDPTGVAAGNAGLDIKPQSATAAARINCFGGCDLSFDSIDVLIIRDGFTFEEAVKELNRR